MQDLSISATIAAPPLSRFLADTMCSANAKNAFAVPILETTYRAGDEIRTHDVHLGKVALYH
jgi:hypothetical protein